MFKRAFRAYYSFIDYYMCCCDYCCCSGIAIWIRLPFVSEICCIQITIAIAETDATEGIEAVTWIMIIWIIVIIFHVALSQTIIASMICNPAAQSECTIQHISNSVRKTSTKTRWLRNCEKWRWIYAHLHNHNTNVFNYFVSLYYGQNRDTQNDSKSSQIFARNPVS